MRASPTLTSLDRKDAIVIVLPQQPVPDGFYELLVNPDIEFDENIDGKLCKRETPQTEFVVHHTVIDNQVTNVQDDDEMPLKDTEMAACLKAMMELISSIPPRYIKYNARLSAQIDSAMSEVEEWERKLCNLAENEDYIIDKTFIQYRIVHILYETWKTVWSQFSPYTRSFNTSKIHSMHSFDIAEQYLNRLWSWRRMLDQKTWQKTSLKFTENHGNSILKPPKLPSNEYNTQAWVYLARRKLVLPSVGVDKSVLNSFRVKFIQSIVKANVHSNEQLEILLRHLLKQHEHTWETQGKAFPSQSILHCIKREFGIE